MKTDPKLLARLERALTHSLTSSLGPKMKPSSTGGKENKKDLEAVGALVELRGLLESKQEVK